MTVTNTKNQILTQEQLREKVPSIFASQEFPSMSEKYKFIPTTEVVDVLGQEGWLPVYAQQMKIRVQTHQGFQKHMIRFRSFNENVKDQLTVGDLFVELILTNSHDGSASFLFNCGLYRLACSNGMVVAEGVFQTIRLVHMQYVKQQAAQICSSIIKTAPALLGTVEDMKKIELDNNDMAFFAEKAKTLRFPKPDLIANELILRPRRNADEGTNLWTVYNVLQENLIKGGTPYQMKDVNGTVRNGHVRAIKNINDTIRINQGLWAITEQILSVRGGF